MIILSKRQKGVTKGVQRPPPLWFKGLTYKIQKKSLATSFSVLPFWYSPEDEQSCLSSFLYHRPPHTYAKLYLFEIVKTMSFDPKLWFFQGCTYRKNKKKSTQGENCNNKNGVIGPIIATLWLINFLKNFARALSPPFRPKNSGIYIMQNTIVVTTSLINSRGRKTCVMQ